ncbi:ubiquitin-domain-containing protein [Tilletiaria anomala UBC 951]|uniref:Ubiquitin-domain-containing protein n=1 Tax=Tilletiaria anomala (strain ATCC 24038 / CBS 436.72 / UBC 951) TaxID=1037660 RepID=A0A066VU24_TILAU|nr:ubiquitin-domain-containing protein [Tilletiaria anomala UBC 951]KDN42299.1 ubiquitin-domain-containing protein [Tilletiaria anomala UBC 951]
MADNEVEAPPINVTIKGPSGLSLSVSISPDANISKLKEEIASKREDFPADSQRLIYSGKVLKDGQTVKEYKVQDGHTIHMVRSAASAHTAPSGGSAQPAASAAGSARVSAAGTGAGVGTTSAATSAEARGVPANFGAGQQFTNNPLSALNRADLAGPHMANFNPFAGTGVNLNDPNMMMNLLEDEGFRGQMRSALASPEVVDQIVSLNPQLASMRPQLQQMLQSERFREMLTNPEMMRQAQQMQAMFGGGGGGGFGAGALFSGLGGAGGGAGGRGAAAQWPPVGAFAPRTGSSDPTTGTGAGTQAGSGAAAGAAPSPGAAGGAPPNLFEMLGQMGGLGAGGAGVGGANPFGGMNPELMRSLMGGMGGAGGLFGAGAGPGAGDIRLPEERYATQLEQMQGMGFTDGARNLRALLMSGGSVEGAITILLEGGAQ